MPDEQLDAHLGRLLPGAEVERPGLADRAQAVALHTGELDVVASTVDLDRHVPERGVPGRAARLHHDDERRGRIQLVGVRAARGVETRPGRVGEEGVEHVEVEASWQERVARLVRVYGAAEPDELLRALARSRRRLGEDRTAVATACLSAGDLRGAVAAVLPVYDAAYEHRVARLGRRVAGRMRVGDPPVFTA
jgi:hypothetical protein